MRNPPAPTGQPLRPRRRSRAGFSILEALIAAAVLGIGLIALVKLHQSAMRGMKTSRSIGIAMDIATQAVEELGGTRPDDLDALGCATIGGCKAGETPLSDTFAAPKPGCTRWVDDGHIPDATNTRPTAPDTEAVAVAAGALYRVDQVVLAHPGLADHPNTRVVEVFVCWRDDDGFVRQVHSSRVVPEGI